MGARGAGRDPARHDADLPLSARQSTRRFAQKGVREIKAVEYIRLNACKGVGVADVVREMGVNPRTAELRFKEIAGHSMRDKILSVRITRAKDLLADPRNSVEAVAVACGYSDARTLRRTRLGISFRSCRPRVGKKMHVDCKRQF